jgi:hypothetical protein
MDERLARDATVYCMRSNGRSGRFRKEYFLGSQVPPGLPISARAAEHFKVSVFHNLSSIADDALSTNSKLSSCTWNWNFHENEHP